MATLSLTLSSCDNLFGYVVIVDSLVFNPSVGESYFVSGTTGQPPKQSKIEGCYSIKNIKETSAILDSLTFTGPYITGCQECITTNSNYILLKDCFGLFGDVIVNIGDITPTPNLNDVFLIDLIIPSEFGGVNFTSCFSISRFLTSSSGYRNVSAVVSYSAQTGCQDCLTNSPIIYQVYDCLNPTNIFYIPFPSSGYENHLVTFTDLLGVTQYCGIVQNMVSNIPTTGVLISDLGIPEKTGITCEDCLNNVADKKKLRDCITSDEVVVWASSLFQSGDTTHLSQGNGCYEILPDVVPPAQPVDINELANYNPQNDCVDCLECHGILFDYVTCEQITQTLPTNRVNTIGDGDNYGSRQIYIDSSNNIYSPFYYSNNVGQYTSLGLNSESNIVLSNPWGVSVDESNGIVCVSNTGGNFVTFFPTSDLTLSFNVSVPMFAGKKVYFDSIDSKFYVVFENTGFPNIAVLSGPAYNSMSFNTAFGNSSSIYTDLVRIGSSLYCLNRTLKQLEVYDLIYTITATYGLIDSPLSLDVDYTNTIIYIATPGGQYIKFNYTTNTVTTIFFGIDCSSTSKEIKIAPLTNTLFITDLDCNHIYEFDLSTDTLIKTIKNFGDYGISQIYGMDTDSSGNLWFGSYGEFFRIEEITDFVNGSSSTNEYVTVGQTFFNPILNACCEITDIYSNTDENNLNIMEYPSLLNFSDCSTCLSSSFETFYCFDCSIGFEAVLIAPSGTYNVGDYIRSQYGNSDWLCFEIQDVYDYDSYGEIGLYLESDGSVYSTCEECQLGATIGITLINTETLQQGQYTVTLDVWSQIAGIPFSAPLNCISDENGVCYQVVDICPIDNVHPLFVPANFYLNQYACRLSEGPPPPVSAGTEYLVCNICDDCCGSGATSTIIVPPHPVWTRPNGQQVTLLDAVALGGMFGLNS